MLFFEMLLFYGVVFLLNFCDLYYYVVFFACHVINFIEVAGELFSCRYISLSLLLTKQ